MNGLGIINDDGSIGLGHILDIAKERGFNVGIAIPIDSNESGMIDGPGATIEDFDEVDRLLDVCDDETLGDLNRELNEMLSALRQSAVDAPNESYESYGSEEQPASDQSPSNRIAFNGTIDVVDNGGIVFDIKAVGDGIDIKLNVVID